MSQISDFADSVNADFVKIQKGVDAVSAEVDKLNSQLTDLNNTKGQLSAADQDSLNKIVATADALVAKVDALGSAASQPTVPPADTGTAPSGAGTPVV